ncbi:MAG TPA: hypothetical protein PKM58_03045 [Pyrinomonadaceae bacterium]|nr:hypothetical protein [Pyrinomonadaceae bacterium]HNU07146.1 hypothetical protein [Pyrinomonadaceae bacterium]
MGQTLEDIREIVGKFDDVTEGTSYGAPSFKIGGKLLACYATNKAAEPNTLVVRVGFDQRDDLIVEQPGVYYLKDHYAPYPYVLVRMDRIAADALAGLLEAGWRFTRSELGRSRK